MLPLAPLAPLSPLATLLSGAPAGEVRAELARLEALGLAGEEGAALAYARGALALREGELDAGRAALSAATFADPEAQGLVRCEVLMAAVRRGPRPAIQGAVAELSAIAAEAGSARVRATALHYHGAAERALGDAVAAGASLLAAFAASEPFLDLRAKVLNSLGTLHVVLGNHGAATALLEHAAELQHQLGDRIGEAIAHGQLGAAALSLGRLDEARRHLQRQEWLASQAGDRQGQARALTFLAEVALEARRPADAADLARRALTVATSVDPPLALWVAYAHRTLGRAALLAGDRAEAAAHVEAAAQTFAGQEHPLGTALCAWDRAHLRGDAGAFFAPAWAIASLGLSARVARLLADRRALGVAGPSEGEALAAVVEAAPHLAAEEEVALVHAAPEALSAIAARRTAARRNLARLAALSIAPPGLWAAAIASAGIGAGPHGLPGDRAAAAAVSELAGAALWVWPGDTPADVVARDLAAARAALGADTRVSLTHRPDARLRSPAFLGEVGARVEGLDAAALLARATGLDPGVLTRENMVTWTTTATAILVDGGLAPGLVCL